mmetsp:Transcript_25194/g.62378  ORF Transcript_25194/g.62378 Transcript_25194/m.62378 type:complete len:249 (+) Transcript_25194:2715-3461(+)
MAERGWWGWGIVVCHGIVHGISHGRAALLSPRISLSQRPKGEPHAIVWSVDSEVVDFQGAGQVALAHAVSDVLGDDGREPVVHRHQLLNLQSRPVPSADDLAVQEHSRLDGGVLQPPDVPVVRQSPAWMQPPSGHVHAWGWPPLDVVVLVAVNAAVDLEDVDFLSWMVGVVAHCTLGLVDGVGSGRPERLPEARIRPRLDPRLEIAERKRLTGDQAAPCVSDELVLHVPWVLQPVHVHLKRTIPDLNL